MPLHDPPDPAQIRTMQAVDEAAWWDMLARWPELAVWVASNRHLPPALVAHLAAHPRTQVRAAIASNAPMDEALMLQLAHDKSDLVRMRIACNAQASRAVLAALVADSCVVVSKHAEARLTHDISGVRLPPSYLDEVSVRDLLH